MNVADEILLQNVTIDAMALNISYHLQGSKSVFESVVEEKLHSFSSNMYGFDLICFEKTVSVTFLLKQTSFVLVYIKNCLHANQIWHLYSQVSASILLPLGKWFKSYHFGALK